MLCSDPEPGSLLSQGNHEDHSDGRDKTGWFPGKKTNSGWKLSEIHFLTIHNCYLNTPYPLHLTVTWKLVPGTHRVHLLTSVWLIELIEPKAWDERPKRHFLVKALGTYIIY